MCEYPGCTKAFSNASDRAKHQNRTHSNAVSTKGLLTSQTGNNCAAIDLKLIQFSITISITLFQVLIICYRGHSIVYFMYKLNFSETIRV